MNKTSHSDSLPIQCARIWFSIISFGLLAALHSPHWSYPFAMLNCELFKLFEKYCAREHENTTDFMLSVMKNP
jgi:hypothetical protein